jgi:hypothetical protein
MLTSLHAKHITSSGASSVLCGVVGVFVPFALRFATPPPPPLFLSLSVGNPCRARAPYPHAQAATLS